MLVYLYDEKGAPIGLKYRTSGYDIDSFQYYFFEKNLQGDVIAIFNDDGDKIGTYSYDAWGVCTATVMNGVGVYEAVVVTTYNPFRYRGYYYDVETGYYYLQSRYYNPNWCRFINADAYVSTGTGLLGYNMFAYCGNNPVMNIDPTGEFPWLFIAIGFGVGMGIAAYIAPTPTQMQADADRHYERNEKNKVDLSASEIINTYEKQSEDMDVYHEYTDGTQGGDAIYNNKYLSSDGGHIEVIICEPPGQTPYIVDETVDVKNMGTYNYASNDDFFLIYFASHFVQDMMPYYLYGNTLDDETGVLKWALD